MLLKEDSGSGGDVEAGAVRDNEEDEGELDGKKGRGGRRRRMEGGRYNGEG